MSRNVVCVNGFGVQKLGTLSLSADLMFKTLCLSADLVLRRWKRYFCQRIWCSMSRNVVPVSGFGVQNLETSCLSADLVFRIWKRCACQWIWCSKFGNVAFLKEFGVPRAGNAVPVNGFGVQCLQTLRLSADLVFRIWKRCACQRIWCSESGNVVPVSGFGVQNLETWRFLKNLVFPGLETLCLSTDLVFNVSKRCACQRIWCSESGNAVPVSGFGVQNLETLCLSVDLVFKVWNVAFLKEFGVPRAGNAVPVNGFRVQCLQTLRLSADLVFRIWKRCTCQRIWCSKSGKAVPVNGFGVQNLETWRFLKNLAFPGLETLCLSTDLVFNVSKRCACQRIWCSESGNVVPVSGFGVQSLETWRFLKNLAFPGLETLCLSTDLVFSVSKRCACQRIWCSESGNVVPVSGFGVQNLETLCLSVDLVFKIWKRGVS